MTSRKIDKSKYDYLPVGNYKTVLVEVPKDDNRGYDYVLSPAITRVVQHLARTRPRWLFVTHFATYSKGYNVERVSRLDVYESGYNLGAFYEDTNHCGDPIITIRNPRVAAKRERGDTAYTKDLKKASKLILDNFFMPTTAERVARVVKDIHASATVVRNNHRNKLYRAHLVVEPAMAAFVEANWEQFTASDQARSFSDTIQEFPELKEAEQGSKCLDPLPIGGVHVLVEGSTYVTRAHDGLLQGASGENLSPAMRAAVGILKLVEDGVFIPNIGLRANETSFYILPQAEDN